MTELEIKTTELNKLIIKGDTINALELLYSDDIIMQENEDEPRIGKQFCIENEKSNLQRVKELNCRLLNQAIDNNKNVVLSEWELIVLYNDNKKIKLTEVSVQHWNKGYIVNEKFYYKDFYTINNI